jgi:hypothetical protein
VVATGSFAGDAPEGACAAEFYLNLGGKGAGGGAASVGKHSGMWVGGLRQGCGATSVTVQRVFGGGVDGTTVGCTTVYDGM